MKFFGSAKSTIFASPFIEMTRLITILASLFLPVALAAQEDGPFNVYVNWHADAQAVVVPSPSAGRFENKDLRLEMKGNLTDKLFYPPAWRSSPLFFLSTYLYNDIRGPQHRCRPVRWQNGPQGSDTLPRPLPSPAFQIPE